MKQMTIQTVSREVYKTSDGQQFDERDAAVTHERSIILRKLLQEKGWPAHNIELACDDLLPHFDELLDQFYAHGVLSSVYGTRDDF